MRKLILSTLLLLCAYISLSQDRFIQFDKTRYERGDTISVSCHLPSYKADDIHLATMYLFVENIDTKQKWSYRYPMLEGLSNADLIIDSTISQGRYAFTFQVRKQFFGVNGNTKNTNGSQLNYVMQTKNSQSHFDKINTDRNGRFVLKDLLFEDTCNFIFSIAKLNRDPLQVTIRTPLDSAFTSDTSLTKIIYIGQQIQTITKEKEESYQADQHSFLSMNTLPEVVVSGRYKSKIEQFNETYSTGLFSNLSEKIFDGMEDTRISSNQNIFLFLEGRVPDLQIVLLNGVYYLHWREGQTFTTKKSTLSNVDVFVDERLIDRVTADIINPNEVAMIKIIPPPAYLTSLGGKGAIAIYSKRDITNAPNTNKNAFKIFGYSPLVARWK
ncbi:MAG: hypothetical protein V4539_22130 [Bacteroidota bacterium]